MLNKKSPEIKINAYNLARSPDKKAVLPGLTKKMLLKILRCKILINRILLV